MPAASLPAGANFAAAAPRRKPRNPTYSAPMKQLIEGYRAFKARRWPEERAHYAELSKGQSPEYLVIACSDSRVDPATIFNAAPGELFVVRNVAAIVPPYESDASHHGTGRAAGRRSSLPQFLDRSLGAGARAFRAHPRSRSAPHGDGARLHPPFVRAADDLSLRGRARASGNLGAERRALRHRRRKIGSSGQNQRRLRDGRLEGFAAGGGGAMGLCGRWHPTLSFALRFMPIEGGKQAAQMPGLYFEEFSVGQTFQHPIRRTVTEADNVFFTAMTHNPAQLHLDEEYGKTTEFGARIVNSLFTLGLMVGISVGETTLGTTVANLGMDEVRFPKPVFHGDTLHVETEVLELRASKSRPGQGIVTFQHKAINQRGEIVAQCKRSALMLGKPASTAPDQTKEQREAAKRLARMGGSDPNATAAPRRRFPR